MHLALIQFDITWEDKPANHAIIEQMIRDARLPRGTFVLLPELGDTGFSFNLNHIVDDRTVSWTQQFAREHSVWIQCGYARRGDDGRGRNCATIISPQGEVAGTYEKMHPFSYGSETDHYGGGKSVLLRRCGEMTVCPLICYDLRFPEIWRLAARAGAELFAIGANWPRERQHHWRSLLIARAIENQAFVCGVNRIGNDPHLGYAGGSIIVDPKGQVLAEAGDEATVLEADLDPDVLRQWRETFPALRDIRSDLLGGVTIDAADGVRSAALRK